MIVRTALAFLIFSLTALIVIGASESQSAGTDGESIRQGILEYLEDLRSRSGDLTNQEQIAKRILATDARMQQLKSAPVQVETESVSIDIWQISTRSNQFNVMLAGPSHFVHFEGTLIPRRNSLPQIRVETVRQGSRW